MGVRGLEQMVVNRKAHAAKLANVQATKKASSSFQSSLIRRVTYCFHCRPTLALTGARLLPRVRVERRVGLPLGKPRSVRLQRKPEAVREERYRMVKTH